MQMAMHYMNNENGVASMFRTGLTFACRSELGSRVARRSASSSLVDRLIRSSSLGSLVARRSAQFVARRSVRAALGTRLAFIHFGNNSNGHLSIWQIMQMASQEGPRHPPRSPTLPWEDE